VLAYYTTQALSQTRTPRQSAITVTSFLRGFASVLRYLRALRATLSLPFDNHELNWGVRAGAHHNVEGLCQHLK